MPLTQVDGGLLSPTNGQFYSMKNRIINGGMVIDQRNSGNSALITTNGQFSVDRWAIQSNPTSKVTIQQNYGSVTPPAGFQKYLGVYVTSAFTPSSNQYCGVAQSIEANNMIDFDWGTANAKTATLSFWVRSSLTGTFGGALQGYVANTCFPFSYTISAANTWEQKTISVPAPTTGTFGTGNTGYITVNFSLGTGSAYLNTAGAWINANSLSSTGETTLVATAGATFYITGVQLEKGSTATSFDYRPYGTELALCQRYYWKTYNTDVAPGSAVNEGRIDQASTGGANRPVVPVRFAVPMRANPTITTYSPSTGASGKCRNDNSGTDVNTGGYGTGHAGTVWYPATTTTLGDAFTAQLVASAEL
jgi:hypothetical protein